MTRYGTLNFSQTYNYMYSTTFSLQKFCLIDAYNRNERINIVGI